MSRRPVTPEELIEDTQYSPLDWPWKTTRLRRDSVQDVRQRSASTNAALGETYHENSKLYPACLDDLAANRLDPDSARLAVLRRSAASARTSSDADKMRSPILQPLLKDVAREENLQLFYALELRLADGEGLVRYEPIAGRLERLRSFSQRDSESLQDSLAVLGIAKRSSAERLFIVAAFSRNEILYGPRAYRRTLLEAGRLVQIVVDEADRRRITNRVVLEFFDRNINHFVAVDGVEEAVVAVVEIGEGR
jgi:hypothetical protein